MAGDFGNGAYSPRALAVPGRAWSTGGCFAVVAPGVLGWGWGAPSVVCPAGHSQALPSCGGAAMHPQAPDLCETQTHKAQRQDSSVPVPFGSSGCSFGVGVAGEGG